MLGGQSASDIEDLGAPKYGKPGTAMCDCQAYSCHGPKGCAQRKEIPNDVRPFGEAIALFDALIDKPESLLKLDPKNQLHQPILAKLHLAFKHAISNSMDMLEGFICPADCEAACVKNGPGNEQPVEIKDTEKHLFLAGMTYGWFDEYVAEDVRRKPPKDKIKNIGIVGAGPAGMNAAYLLWRAGHNVTVLDKQQQIGGLYWQIPDDKLPKDYVKFYDSLYRATGMTFKMGENVTPQILETYAFDEVVLATGVMESARWVELNVSEAQVVPQQEEPNVTKYRKNLQEVEGVRQSIEVMWAKDFSQYAGKDVVVYGGGLTANDDLRELAKVKPNSVTMLDRNPESGEPGHWTKPPERLKNDRDYRQESIKMLKDADVKVKVIYNSQANEVVLGEDGKLQGVIIDLTAFEQQEHELLPKAERSKLKKRGSSADSLGETMSHPLTGEPLEEHQYYVACTQMLLALGSQKSTSNELVKGLELNIDENTGAITDVIVGATAKPHIWVAGDLDPNHLIGRDDKTETVIAASASGSQTAAAMLHCFKKEQSWEGFRSLRGRPGCDNSDLIPQPIGDLLQKLDKSHFHLAIAFSAGSQADKARAM